MLDKIRKLIAHAEGTDNLVEATTFMYKARSLMQEYAITEAEAMASGKVEKETPTTKDIQVPSRKPGGAWKRGLLNTIAQQNRSRCWSVGSYTCVIAGFKSDLSFVEALYTSIMVQLEGALIDGMVNRPEHVHGRTYRTSFINGYCQEIVERLKALKQQDDEGTSTALVLVKREEEVDAFGAQFGLRKGKKHYSRTNWQAHKAGAAAAKRADLGVSNKINGSNKVIHR